MTCRTCRYLEVPLNKAQRRVPRREVYYACNVPLPLWPTLPASVVSFMWPPPRVRMSPEHGEDCPLHEERLP